MEFSKLFPKAPFDLLTRLLPGLLVLLFLPWATGTTTSEVLVAAVGQAASPENSAFIFTASLFCFSFVVGTLAAEVSGKLERWLSIHRPPLIERAQQGVESSLPKSIHDFIASWEAIDATARNAELYRWYTLLLKSSPNEAHELRDLRARYRMFSTLAVVLFASSGVLAIAVAAESSGTIVAALVAIGAGIAAWTTQKRGIDQSAAVGMAVVAAVSLIVLLFLTILNPQFWFMAGCALSTYLCLDAYLRHMDIFQRSTLFLAEDLKRHQAAQQSESK